LSVNYLVAVLLFETGKVQRVEEDGVPVTEVKVLYVS
jgi:hypothetical protein